MRETLCATPMSPLESSLVRSSGQHCSLHRVLWNRVSLWVSLQGDLCFTVSDGNDMVWPPLLIIMFPE